MAIVLAAIEGAAKTTERKAQHGRQLLRVAGRLPRGRSDVARQAADRVVPPSRRAGLALLACREARASVPDAWPSGASFFTER